MTKMSEVGVVVVNPSEMAFLVATHLQMCSVSNILNNLLTLASRCLKLDRQADVTSL